MSIYVLEMSKQFVKGKDPIKVVTRPDQYPWPLLSNKKEKVKRYYQNGF